MPKRKREPGLYKVGSTWYINFIHPITGTRLRYSTKTSDETRAREKLEKDKARAWDEKEGKQVDWTWRELIDWTWENHWSEKHGTSKEVIEMTITKFMKEFQDKIVVKTTLEEFRAYQKKRHLTVKFSSTNRELTSLKFAIHRAMEAEKIFKDPIIAIKCRSEKRLRRDRNATTQEKELLLANANPWLAKIIEFALEGGMRLGEIIATRPQDVNRAERVVMAVSEKGGEISKRFVPITERMATLLDSLDFTQATLFRGHFGDKISSAHVSHVFRLLCQRIGIQDLHFHDLRHTFATDLWRRTRDIVLITKILGHTEFDTTMVYLNLKITDLTSKPVNSPQMDEFVTNLSQGNG